MRGGALVALNLSHHGIGDASLGVGLLDDGELAVGVRRDPRQVRDADDLALGGEAEGRLPSWHGIY